MFFICFIIKCILVVLLGRRERETLMAKLQEVEANLLVGNQLMDEAKKQESALVQKKELLEAKKVCVCSLFL